MPTDVFNDLDWYAPWPKFGVNLSQQWQEIRVNTESLAPLVHSLYVDADPNSIKTGDLAGIEFGEEDFHNKFRMIWERSSEEFRFQCNDGTESIPLWHDAFYINCSDGNIVFKLDGVFLNDVSVAGDFYTSSGVISSIVVKDTSGIKIYSTDEITFNREHFYISPDSTGKPIINLSGGSGGGSGTITGGSNLGSGEGVFAGVLGSDLTFKSLIGGTGVTLSSSASEITIDADGLTVQETDGNPPPYTGVRQLEFNRDDFYITQNANTDRAIVNLRITDPLDQITFSQTGDDSFPILSDELKVNRLNFYITQDSSGTPILNLSDFPIEFGDQVVSGVKVGEFSASREWIFSHNLGSRPLLWNTYDSGYSAFIPEKVDVSDPNVAYFYMTSDVAGRAIVSTGVISPRINFSTNNNQESQFSSDTVKFDRNFFYLEPDTHGHPVVSFTNNPDFFEKKVSTFLAAANYSNNTTTLTAIPSLSFPIEANVFYSFKFNAILSTTNVGEGVTFDLVWNNLASTQVFSANSRLGVAQTSTAGINSKTLWILDRGHAVTSWPVGPNIPVFNVIEGVVMVTVNDVVSFRLATEVGGANSVSLFTGSFVEWRKLGSL